MKQKSLFGGALLSLVILGGSVASAVPPARTIELTADDTMKFSNTALTAAPGEALQVKLTNKGTLPKVVGGHNFVLLKTGVDVSALTTAAVMAGQTEYIPDKFKDQILASTKLAGPGETVEVTFTAPAAPGPYQFLCTFPGHSASMKGTLTIK